MASPEETTRPRRVRPGRGFFGQELPRERDSTTDPGPGSSGVGARTQRNPQRITDTGGFSASSGKERLGASLAVHALACSPCSAS